MPSLSKGILVRHTSLIESELKAPSNVTSNWIYYQIPIRLHVKESEFDNKSNYWSHWTEPLVHFQFMPPIYMYRHT
jgi:hypothetical protein